MAAVLVQSLQHAQLTKKKMEHCATHGAMKAIMESALYVGKLVQKISKTEGLSVKNQKPMEEEQVNGKDQNVRRMV